MIKGEQGSIKKMSMAQRNFKRLDIVTYDVEKEKKCVQLENDVQVQNYKIEKLANDRERQKAEKKKHKLQKINLENVKLELMQKLDEM